jgi:chitinase
LSQRFRSRSRGLIAAATTAIVIAATGGAMLTLSGTAQAAPNDTTGAAATSGGLKVAYFDQWSIYQNAFYVKNLDTEGIAGNLNYLIYDFENIDPTNLTCTESEKASDPDPAGENDPDAGDGAGDMDADYGKPFPANEAVNGVADSSTQAIAGNFNQLKELKAKYPNLKVLLSIGGWTYSKYFSEVAATAASRQKFVSSCINEFIDGNLPSDSDYGPTYGGAGSAAGIFDGFDIDWEYPGSTDGHLGNITSPNDTADYTALLGEFRSELNTAGTANGKIYALSAALPAGQNNVAEIQTNQIGQYLTFGDLMSYDMYGAWNATGPTDEQDPLYANPNSPETKVAPGNETFSIDNSVKAWTVGDPAYSIAGGFPASKLTLGLPFYYRGWTGVPAGSNHGLYQTATGPSAGQTDSGDVPGIAMYKELSGTVDNAADTYWDPITDSAYFYDGTNFYGGEDAQSIQARADYAHCNGLGGFMMFSLYDLDPATTLFDDATSDISGSAASCPTAPTSSATASASASTSKSATASPSASATGTASATASATATATKTATSSPTVTPTKTTSSPTASASATPSATATSAPGNLLTNPGFESGSLSGWTCLADDSVVKTPVHSGNDALKGTPSNTDTAQCSQTVTVKPSTTYTLTAWVDGSYVYIGGNGTTSASTWTPGTTGFQTLSTPITTTAAQTTMTIYVHGWYGQPTFYADDFSLVG